MAIPVGNHRQSLSLNQTPDTCNDQCFNGGQMMTGNNSQILSGGYQLVAVPHPVLPAFTVSPLTWEQLPEKHLNLQTKSSPFTKKPESLKPYLCPHQDCGKCYSRSSCLRIHQRAHSGEKPYACNVQGCKWRFGRSDELKRHMRRHTGERPYKCETCPKSFARSDHLTQHQRVHRSLRLGLEPSSL
ncbi:Krueppel-like factor 17 [Fukomys damarensis]|uniref:Krueppel-like factor 17 n=1 Tax=Fukomys damarensis TaxID=885580 RepID=A0A091E0A0_FUKDA|nr:Krueppel-like factor 17 [Fukomys damarensis]